MDYLLRVESYIVKMAIGGHRYCAQIRRLVYLAIKVDRALESMYYYTTIYKYTTHIAFSEYISARLIQVRASILDIKRCSLYAHILRAI